MTGKELCARIAARTGASGQEVEAVVREFFPQAFAMAMGRKWGTLAVPHFATFSCRPRKSGGMKLAFRPRTPEELIASAGIRRGRLASRQARSDGHSSRSSPKLSGTPYAPRPNRPPDVAEAPRKGGFLARLLGLGR